MLLPSKPEHLQPFGRGGRYGAQARNSHANRALAMYEGVKDPGELSGEVKGYLARAGDPATFAWMLGFNADPWQVKFLRSDYPTKLLNNSRQSGKSTTVAVAVAHRVIYQPGCLVLILAAGERQSLELMRKVYAVLALAQDRPVFIHEGASELETADGSRVIALPAKEGTVRSYSAVDLLIFDEASRVPDELYMSVLPMVATSQGDVWALSTPFGSRGWWYEEVRSVKEHLARPVVGMMPDLDLPPWDYYEIPAPMCPRLTPEFLALMKQKMGEWWFEQEFMCKFMDPQTAAFSQEEIDLAFKENVIAWAL